MPAYLPPAGGGAAVPASLLSDVAALKAFQASVTPDVAGLKTSQAATQAQQTQLMGAAALKEEQSASVTIGALNDPPTAYISASTVTTIFVPQYPLQITSIGFSWEYFNLAVSDTDYWTVSVQKRTGGTGTSFVSKNTMVLGEAITARKPWRLDGSSWNLTNNKLALTDVLSLNIFTTGAPAPMRLPMTVSWRWLPL